jgi:hypothetical protein
MIGKAALGIPSCEVAIIVVANAKPCFQKSAIVWRATPLVQQATYNLQVTASAVGVLAVLDSDLFAIEPYFVIPDGAINRQGARARTWHASHLEITRRATTRWRAPGFQFYKTVSDDTSRQAHDVKPIKENDKHEQSTSKNGLIVISHTHQIQPIVQHAENQYTF